MVNRKLKMMMSVAIVAAFMFAGGDVSVYGQQYIGYSGTNSSTCSSCYSQVEFPSTNAYATESFPVAQTLPVSQPLPVQSYQTAQPLPFVETLPQASSFVASTVNGAIISAPTVNQTYSYQPAISYQQAANVISQPVTGTYATGGTVIGQTILSNPQGTFTSRPTSVVTNSIPAVSSPIVQPAVTYATARSTPVRSTLSAGYQVVGNSVGTVTSGLAQMKANQAANGRIRGHVGGGLGGAQYEGVGWSSQSPQAAIQQCCYWGTRPVSQIGVRQGPDGLWYACVLYQ